MNPYLNFVSDYARVVSQAKSVPLGQVAPAARRAVAAGAPKVMIFAPHPDDEVIIGGLALRLMREAGWRAINVAVTQGSNKARQLPRLEELKRCCEFIGFELLQTAPTGLEGVTRKTREQDPAAWAKLVKVIADILAAHQPKVLLYPHAQDWNGTHIGTHFLVTDALKSLPADFQCHCVETEFWAPMGNPNLMVEIGAPDLADLIGALSYHVGEVQRNPYHLSLPAWMADNVRRGGEVVGGQGGAAPDFLFATLYRLQRWTGKEFQPAHAGGKILSAKDNPAALFR